MPRAPVFALARLAASGVLACGGGDAPPGPTAPGTPIVPSPPSGLGVPSAPGAPSPDRGAWVGVMVIEDSGLCIDGATVVVVAGEGVGQSGTHTRPCDVWGYDTEILFEGLTPGAAVPLRASAPGYTAQEVTAYAQLSGQATEIVLARAP